MDIAKRHHPKACLNHRRGRRPRRPAFPRQPVIRSLKGSIQRMTNPKLSGNEIFKEEAINALKRIIYLNEHYDTLENEVRNYEILGVIT